MGMKAILTCCLLLLSGELALAADLPQPRTLSRSKLGPHHTKASSFAPQVHSKNHVYGAPIATPILHRSRPAKKKPSHAPANTSAPKTSAP
jgi:hypothetical protein